MVELNGNEVVFRWQDALDARPHCITVLGSERGAFQEALWSAIRLTGQPVEVYQDAIVVASFTVCVIWVLGHKVVISGFSNRGIVKADMFPPTPSLLHGDAAWALRLVKKVEAL